MKFAILLSLLALPLLTYGEEKKPVPTLKSILLEQLRTTHNQKEWFAPADVAMDGLTAEQANWKDGKGNHSVGELVSHLVYWNSDELAKFKGETPPKYSGNNDDTFAFDPKQWEASVKRFDQVMSEWEKAVEAADEAKLKDWYSIIAHIGAHNAYHLGEIVYVRKEQGSWDASKGVK
jgi:hypothetical protein